MLPDRTFALVVGNGLTIDLCRGYGPGALGGWDTSRPLSWPVRAPGHGYDLLRDYLPVFDAAVRRHQGGGVDDFTVIDRIAADGVDDMALDCELRHYLALAYSEFQAAVDAVDLAGWRWVEWLRSLVRPFVGGFSFNYDLVLEAAFEAAGVPYQRLLREEQSEGGVVVVKPHGSIDFEYDERYISRAAATYPVAVLTRANNMPPRRVARSALLSARLGPELVAPLQASYIRHFQWVAPGFDWFANIGRELSCCIIAGISYWPTDRPEINEILDSLGGSTEVVVANPVPPDDLLQAIESRGLPCRVFDGPPTL